MKIEVFTLCDAAADYQGRLSVLGVFDSIITTNLPALHPQCAVALRARFYEADNGKHTLALNIVDSDGNPIVEPPVEPPTAHVDIHLPENEQTGTINLVFNLQMLPFAKYGEYIIKLMIDDHEEASLLFWVRQSG